MLEDIKQRQLQILAKINNLGEKNNKRWWWSIRNTNWVKISYKREEWFETTWAVTEWPWKKFRKKKIGE